MEKPGHHLQRIDLFGPTLWLQYFERLLFSFNLESEEFQRETPPFVSAVDDFFLLPDGRIVVAMEGGDIWINTSGDWEFLSEIPFAGLKKGFTKTPCPRMNHRGFGMVPEKERTYRLILQGDYIAVLSPLNLYRFSLDSGEWEIVPLSEWIFDAVQITLAAGPGSLLYVGFNRGELQGGLKLIEGDTGRVSTIDGRQPVSGILPDPVMDDSMVVSAGCCHRNLEFGGLYRVCGNRMDPIYRNSAIFDIKTSNTSIVGAGNGSCLFYDGNKILSNPPGIFSERNGLVCSDLSKSAFQVVTDINTVISCSGLTPLIAIRRN